MIKRILVLFLIIILFTSCAKKEPMIVKKEVADNNDIDNLEHVTMDMEEPDKEFIEFTLEDEVITVNIQAIPILQNYLSVAPDKDHVLEKMNLIPVQNENDYTLYILEFSCENNQCSYLLLDGDKKHKAYLVTDIAKLVQYQVSPKDEYVFFEFDRLTEFTIPVSHLVVFHIEEWNEVNLQSTYTQNILHYTFPFEVNGWINDDTISISKPLIKQLTSQNLIQWRQLGEPTTDVTLTVIN